MYIDYKADSPITLVQISDTHLSPDTSGELLNMNTDQSLDCVLSLVERAALDIQLMLCTGDLSNNGSLAAYRRFREKLQRFSAPSAWLMGNHDHSEHMRQSCPEGKELAKVIAIGRWQVVMLDSSIPMRVEGTLAEQELNFLEQQLENNPEYYQLICLHHHVLPVGCAWLDKQRIANAEQLLDLLSRFSNVKGLLSGHVHQVFEQDYQGIKVMTSPSSCIQFAPNSDDFKVDSLNPGYRNLQLLPNGDINSSVSRVTGVSFDVNYDSLGY